MLQNLAQEFSKHLIRIYQTIVIYYKNKNEHNLSLRFLEKCVDIANARTTRTAELLND